MRKINHLCTALGRHWVALSCRSRLQKTCTKSGEGTAKAPAFWVGACFLLACSDRRLRGNATQVAGRRAAKASASLPKGRICRKIQSSDWQAGATPPGVGLPGPAGRNFARYRFFGAARLRMTKWRLGQFFREAEPAGRARRSRILRASARRGYGSLDLRSKKTDPSLRSG